MFVASYARLPPGSRFHLSVNVQIFPCNAKNIGFLRLQSIFYGSGPLLQRAVPPRYHSGPPLQCAVPPRYHSGPPLQCAVPPRPLYCNARHRLGTASVLVGPSIIARALCYNARYDSFDPTQCFCTSDWRRCVCRLCTPRVRR